jgi:hypothetical protein
MIDYLRPALSWTAHSEWVGIALMRTRREIDRDELT